MSPYRFKPVSLLSFLTLLLSTILVSSAFAQTSSNPPQGMGSFDSFQGGELDHINLGTGNLYFRAPLIDFPQRGDALKLSFSLQSNNKSFSILSGSWKPSGGYISGSLPTVAVVDDQAPGLILQSGGRCGEHFWTYTVISPDSNAHYLGTVYGTGTSAPLCYQLPYKRISTKDGSGYALYTSSGGGIPGVNQVIDRHGVRGGTTREDANGNKISFSNSNYVDSLGRVIPFPNFSTGNTLDFTGCSGPMPIAYVVMWTLPAPGGGSALYKLCYVNIAVRTNFQWPGINEYAATASFLQSVVLPNNTTWTFEYDSRSLGDPLTINYGDLTKITFPTGATTSYAYVNLIFPACQGVGIGCSQPVSRVVSSRTVNANDGLGFQTWNYQWTANTSSSPWLVTCTLTDPLGNATVVNSNQPFQRWNEIRRDAYMGSPVTGTLLLSVTTDWSTRDFPIRTTLVWPNGKTKKIERDFDTSDIGLVLALREYDYGIGAPGPLLRQAQNTYLPLGNAAYLFTNKLDLLTVQTIMDGLGRQVARTSFGYDGSPLISSGITTQLNPAPASGTARGNQTTVRQWIDGSTTSTSNCPVSVFNGDVISTMTYYDTGMVAQSTDPCNHSSVFSYSLNFAGAYLTQARLPDTNSPNFASHISSSNYDFNTGLTTASTDQNGQVTSFGYDNLRRPTTVAAPFPDGGQTNLFYPDANTVEIRKQIDNTRWTDQFVRVDGLGREIRRITANDESTPWDHVDTCYDAKGRVSFKSYPYQGGGLLSPQVCSGAGDSFQYDAIGRRTTVTHSDGSTLLSSYAGPATSVMDEGNGAQRIQRITQVDGLGRLVSVCEITNTVLIGASGTPGSCGQDIAAAGFLTTYGFDTLGNLTSVAQGGLLPRTAQYDSLSRLISSSNPESGTIQYAYDADGLLIVRTAPKPNQTSASVTVTTTISYDPLHRVRAKNYSDSSTPATTINYDETSALGVSGLLNTIGRPSSATVAGSFAGEVFSYDQLGGIRVNSQCTPQNCSTGGIFSLNYTYDLLGNVATMMDGVGVTFSVTYNRALRLTTMASNFVDSNHPATLLQNVHYGSFGVISDLLANGVSESYAYSPRGRLQSYTATNGTSTIYSFGLGFAPNGDILTANDIVNENWTYAYDDLNRLSGASKNGGTEVYSYDYDRFGNRWHQNGPHAMMLSFSAGNNHMDGYSYDAAGNLLNDGSHTYAYDAENRIISVDGGATAYYVYDANGRRVRKTSPAGSFDYLYDLASREITQVTTGGGWYRSEIYAGTRHLAAYWNSTTYFVHRDWLGTERARSSVSGASYENCTSLPYGDWLTCSTTDASPIHFTGKERDAESGLDAFGARYYNSTLARWVTPDWSAREEAVPYGDPDNPQTLNLYAYVANNPTSHLDPYGHAQSADQMKSMLSSYQFDSANDLWLVGGRIWSPNGGTSPITVKENVIYDTEARRGVGLNEKDKAQFASMQKETGQLYGQINIRFDVTYRDGEIVWTTGGYPGYVNGAEQGALNVVVQDHRLGVWAAGASGDGSGASYIFQGKAFSWVGLAAAEHWTLSHEFAHHFLGNTMGNASIWEQLVRGVAGDIYINRFVLPNITSFSDRLRHYASSPCFTGGSCP
jgi:RHS repeat-associated protein